MKVLWMSKRKVGIVSTLGLVFALLVAAPLHPEWLVEGLARYSPEVLYFVETARPLVALTIDDGPDPVATPRILDVLKRHGARATFFVITDRVAGNEALLRRILEEGHELGNHLTRDEPSIRLPDEEFERQLLTAHEILSAYSEVRWFRPGSGWFDNAMLRTLEGHAYSCALGSVYPFDAEVPSTWFATRYVLSNVEPGSIIVVHDVGARGLRTAAVLESVLPELETRGLQVVTLSTLARSGERGR